MKWFVAVGILVGIVLLASFIYFSPQKSQNTTIDTPSPSSPPGQYEARASFAIFTNGTWRIFSEAKYHNLSEDVYIQQDNPNVVHVKKSEVTWGDFFATLPMRVSRECLITGTGQTFCSTGPQQLKFYLNGRLHPRALEVSIQNGDRLLVSFGDEAESEINTQLQQVPPLEK